MRVVIFGASHGVGRETAVAALAAGHQVRGYARRPERAGIFHERFEPFPGDAQNAEQVAAAAEGQDAAIITLGLPTLKAMGFGKSRILSAGTRNVANAMRSGGGRIILLTAIGTSESKDRLGLFYRFSLRGGLGWQFGEKDEQERLVSQSGLPFVIVRPTTLSNATRRGGARIDPERRYRMFTQVSRQEVADFLIEQLGEDARLGEAVIVSEPHRHGEFFDWLRHYR